MAISSDEAQAAVPLLWSKISVLEQALSMEELDIFIVRHHAQLLSSKQRYSFLSNVLDALQTLHQEAQHVQQLINERASIRSMMLEDDNTDDDGSNLLQKMLVNNLLQLVEAVQRWRNVMTQPLPVLREDGTNYLLWLLMDLASTAELAAVRNSSSVTALAVSSGNCLSTSNNSTAVNNSNAAGSKNKSKTKQLRFEGFRQPSQTVFTLENSGHFPYTYIEPRHALSDVGHASLQAYNSALGFLKEDYALQIELWRRKRQLVERHGQVEPLLRVVMAAVGAFTIPEHFVASYKRNVTDCLRLTSHCLQMQELELLSLSKPHTRLDWKTYFGSVKAPPYFAQIVKSTSVVEQLNAANASIMLRRYLETWKRFNLWKESCELSKEMCLLAEQQLRRMRFRIWMRFVMARRHQAVMDTLVQKRGQLQASLSAPGDAGKQRSLSYSHRALSMSISQNQPAADSDLSVMADRGEMATQAGRSKRTFPIVR